VGSKAKVAIGERREVPYLPKEKESLPPNHITIWGAAILGEKGTELFPKKKVDLRRKGKKHSWNLEGKESPRLCDKGASQKKEKRTGIEIMDRFCVAFRKGGGLCVKLQKRLITKVPPKRARSGIEEEVRVKPLPN